MDNSTLTGGNLDNANLVDPMVDLFGDAGDDIAADMPGSPQHALPAHLVQRVAEMQRTGCCTTLAWSNSGFVARISDDGRNAAFNTIRRSPETGEWQLSDSSTEPVRAPINANFVHLQWSSSGIELALVDSQGMVHYRVLSAPLGRMVQASFPEQNLQTDAGDVIGMHWLSVYPTDFRAPIISPITKREKTWHSTMSARDASGAKVHHPVDGRSAFLWLSSYMTLTLAYQQVGNGWHKNEVSVEAVTSSEETCTHAAFCANAGDLLLATVDQGTNLRLHKVTVQWNLSQITKPQGTLNIVQPSIEIRRLAGAERIEPQQGDTAHLSILKLLPPAAHGDTQTQGSLPTIMAVFSHASVSTNISSNQRNAMSVIARWNIESVASNLHDSFSKLKTSAEASLPLQSKTVLRRQQDIVTPKIILSVDSQITDTDLAFSASDGTVDFRERSTFNSIVYYGDTTFVSNLPQTGFEHTPVGHALAVAPSPGGSAVVYQPPGKEIQVKFMTLSYGWQPMYDGLNDPDSLIEAAIVCVARQYAVLANHNHSTDEVLALLPTTGLSREQKQAFDKHIVLIMARNPDISMLPFDKQKMLAMKEPLLPRAQSAQLALHDNLDSGERQMQGKVSWCLLNLRAACSALFCVRQGQEANHAGFTGTMSSLRGVAHWGLDMLLFVVDSLLAFTRTLKDVASVQEAGQRHLDTTHDPAIILVLSSYPRIFLKLLSQLLQHYLRCLPHAMQRASTVLERHEMADIYDYFTNRVPVKLTAVDSIISDADNAVRSTFQEQQLSDQRRREIELKLICHAQIAPELSSVLERLVQTALPSVSDVIDAGGLYFTDTTWLGIHSSQGNKKHGQALDIITKLPISAGVQPRQCRRCGSVTEALSAEKMNKGIASWLHVAKRHCICGNYWTLP